MKRASKLITLLLLVITHSACVKNRTFDPPPINCSEILVANTSYAEVKNKYVDQTFQIQEDLIISGYVISSDRDGNFFSVLHFQDSPENPTEGFQMEIDVRDTHLFYPVGSKIYIKLKGLYLGRSRDVFKIGGVFTSFGNESVGRLPAAVVDRHIFVSCDEVVAIQPKVVSIDELDNAMTNTLVAFTNIEILEEELGLPYAVEREETERTLVDCSDNEIVLLNSGFSDFQEEVLPNGNGTIKGVLLRENNDFQLAIRSLEDIDFPQDRCQGPTDAVTSQNILISELADPENNTGARFVEIFNSGGEPLSLKGWQLLRYTNDNSDVGSIIDLSDYTIGAENTLIISPNGDEFERVYGFPPDVMAGRNSAADSNGDDNLELVDPFGTVIDAFGVVGEDGSGTDHEFQNGRALRKSDIVLGNPIYTSAEWTLYNDTGDSGTINRPQKAPDDFTPGSRN